MPKNNPDPRRARKDDGLALVVIEVVRATNDGKAPLNQKQILDGLRSNWPTISAQWDGGPAKATVHSWVSELTRRKSGTGKPWLRKDGQKVRLADERILMGSPSIKALLTAFGMRDEEDWFDVQQWMLFCDSMLSLSEKDCQKFLGDYTESGYVVKTKASGPGGRMKLVRRRINQDLFYLKLAADASLRESLP